ncbi:MAG: hypothetical protein ABW044_06570 [Cellvibrio sp.]
MQTNIKKLDASSKPNGISAEFKHFLSDIEDLVAQATSLTGEDLKKAKNSLNTRIDAAKHSIEDLSGNIAQKARTSATATNEYVHQQPWVAIGAGAAIGLLVGYLVSRRD